MAKRRSNTSPAIKMPTDADAASARTGTAEEKIVDFAEDLGRILGTAQKKASDWMGQRQTVVKQLEGIRTTADQLLQQLGNLSSAVVRRDRKPGRLAQVAADSTQPSRRGRPPGSGRKTKRRAMTAAQRKAVGDRMRKYWAARRKQKK
jgi:hypothetical protein